MNINAYHQPGVEAGKKAAGAVLELQRKVLAALREDRRGAAPPRSWPRPWARADEVETVFKVLEHLAANPDHGVKREPGTTRFDTRFRAG